MGSGFILNSTLEATAAYLDDILSIDSDILSDPSLLWQAQTLGQFSAHILVPRSDVDYTPKIDEILMDSTTKMLQLMAELGELNNQRMELIEVNKFLTNRLNQLEPSALQTGGKGKSRAVETGARTNSPSSDSHHTPCANNGVVLGDSSSRILDHSEELARLLQAQFDEEDQNLATERQKLQKRTKTFECGICLETFEKDFVARVRGCKHSFCRDCLCQYATTTIQDRRYPIPCPICLADNSKKPMSKLIVFDVD
jgi:hypothetical protein